MGCHMGRMTERPQIKICGITRETDAEQALALGADFLGVIVWERSPRRVEAARAQELARAIPAGKRVLVSVNPGTEEVAEWRGWGFDFFQLHCPWDLDLATLAGWAGGLGGAGRLWLAPKLPPGEPFPQGALAFADTVVFDAFARDPLLFGGTGRQADWERAAELRTLYAHKRWVLAGGLHPGNVAEAWAAVRPDVLDVNSGVESVPGIKDEGKLRALFSALR